MGCRKTLSALTKALKANERNVDVYLAVIKALGDLGDPRAIPSLSKNFWNQKDIAVGIRAAQAKITALGYIRSKKSVDALIDMLYVADPLSMMSVAAHLQASLKRLTGEDFGWDRDRWRDWWKKSERKFKLEED
jgi:HEAT repeat protein